MVGVHRRGTCADTPCLLPTLPARSPLPSVVTNPASEVHEDKVAASATCQSPVCDRVALKLVNFSSFRQRIAGGWPRGALCCAVLRCVC